MPTTQITPRVEAEPVWLVYQPIVDLTSGSVIAHEVLSRPAPNSPSATITHLLDTARRNGELWSLEAVIRELALASAANNDSLDCVFINCSPIVAGDPRFVDHIAEALERHGVDRDRVVLEITECDHDDTEERLRGRVEALRESGLSVALDDVGAGASGLGRLLGLNPDWIKLDRGLVHQIDRDPCRQSVARFLVQFAQLSGARVIAEGVETKADLRAIADLGVTHAQGFLFAEPSPELDRIEPDRLMLAANAWASRLVEPSASPIASSVSVLASKATLLSGEMTIGDAAAFLMGERDRGVVVNSHAGPIGWLPRETLMAHARSGRSHELLSSSIRPQPSIEAETSLADAMEIAAGRSESLASTPLIVTDNMKCIGVVHVSSLLAAASEMLTPPSAQRLAA